MKDKILFQDFLTDRRIYTLNESFWQREVRQLLADHQAAEPKALYQTTYADGNTFHDGNPILSLKLNPRKSLRIIQEAAESNPPDISGWIEEKTEDTPTSHELVISLELSEQTKNTALQWIAAWVDDAVNVEQMELLLG